MTPPAPGPPTGPVQLTARCPEDLLALVPVVLGFVPARSVAMLTFGGPRPFHARVDLPATGAGAAEVVDCLLRPARRHRVGSVVFVIYTDDRVAAEQVLGPLVAAFVGAGIRVVACLRADGRRWFPTRGSAGRRFSEVGVPYDLSTHAFTAEAVLAGRAVRGSRDELAAGLRPDPEGVAATEATLGTVVGFGVEEIAATITCCLGVRRPTDREVAGLLLGLATTALPPGTPDSLGLRRDAASEHLQLWTDVLRRSPEHLAADPAALVALAAWLSGDGALAWCAVDRCREVEPQHTLAALVAEALERAVPPTGWDSAGEDGPSLDAAS